MFIFYAMAGDRKTAEDKKQLSSNKNQDIFKIYSTSFP